MSEFVCLIIFLIGFKFRLSETTDTEFTNAGTFSVSSELRTNNNLPEDNKRQKEMSSNYDERNASRGKKVLPVALAFMTSALLMGSFKFIKFLLLKGAILLNFVLIICGFIFTQHIYESGISFLVQHHWDFRPVKNFQYPENEPDLSGYGYEYNYHARSS